MMNETVVCNLLACMRFPPWNTKLSQSRHTTTDWEERIPFHTYVQPDSCSSSDSVVRRPPGHEDTPQSSLSLSTSTLPLPIELQLHILSFCSTPTLFKCMHVCSQLRKLASKLFYGGDPDAYYHVDAYWLLNGALPGYTSSDMSFLPCVQNVEVEWHRGLEGDMRLHSFDDSGGGSDEDVKRMRDEMVGAYWRGFEERFPNAKNVVVNMNYKRVFLRRRGGGEWIHAPVGVVPREMEVLMRGCPAGVQEFVFVLEIEGEMGREEVVNVGSAWRRSMYRRDAVEDTWTRVDVEPQYRHKTVLMPRRRFHGPVGRWERLQYEGERITQQLSGLWPLSLEALDRHHFDNGRHEPFSCPSSSGGCEAYFEKAGEWMTHAAAESHVRNSQPGKPFCKLPGELDAVFEERQRGLIASSRAIDVEVQERVDEWIEGGKEGREQIEREWMEQLENEGKTWGTGEEKAKENGLWKAYVSRMEESMSEEESDE